ncbi:CPBP family intramembrane metalloprotease [Corynebacterium sp. MC-17D]|uniref:CPBP family intramembrane metalloprotease n=1 Tax=Corynebacterium lipophilum TaxID=2804918 RepID=A0AAW5HX77_9CORY|nr:type II CAAX endopeptidase family protein [Corynebacterium lipophilum]MCO6394376.1 CPBP family intramembrane metalloprotease [Corynebacterium lipophilum]MCZ2117907.1 CPBP family intramembrane metalloprotease [Corynebacterium lipophilum]
MQPYPEYHLLAAERPWWRALIEALLLVAFFLTLTLAAFFFLDATGDMESQLAIVLSLALTLPAAFLAARVAGRDPALLVSVAGRVRWPIVLRSSLVMLVLFGLTTPWEDIDLTPILLMYVLITPFQAASEEFMFRGAIPQIVGTWVRSPWVAYAVPVIPFVALHEYNWIGLTDILVFTICVSALVWYTGGLEAAVVMHAFNNISVFFIEPDASPTELGWVDLAFSSAFTIGATLLLLAINRRKRPDPTSHIVPDAVN